MQWIILVKTKEGFLGSTQALSIKGQKIINDFRVQHQIKMRKREAVSGSNASSFSFFINTVLAF